MAKSFQYSQEEIDAKEAANAELTKQAKQYKAEEDNFIFTHKYDRLIAAGIAGLLFSALLNIIIVLALWINWDSFVINMSNINVSETKTGITLPVMNISETTRHIAWSISFLASIATIVLAINFLFFRSRKLRFALGITSFFMMGALLISFFFVMAIFSILVLIGKDKPTGSGFDQEIKISDL